MKIEKPCSPGHCLGMLNANMRTDMLRHVHEGMLARKDQRERQLHKKSPLAMLIESIEDVLTVFEGNALMTAIGPNPFNTDPHYLRFQPEPDYHHDIGLLKAQLASLREILVEISRW